MSNALNRILILLCLLSSPLTGVASDDAISHIGGDFTLQSLGGNVSLKDYRGKVVLLYFGYINCPDACPTTLSQWSKAFRLLNNSEQKKVQGIMVSVDPERDTVKELDAFVGFFNKNIIGLTSDLQTLRKVTALYDARFEIAPHKPGKNYAVDHSFYTFVIDGRGKVVDRVDFTLSIKELAAKIRKYID